MELVSLLNYKHSHSVSVLRDVPPLSYTSHAIIQYCKEIRSQFSHKLYIYLNIYFILFLFNLMMAFWAAICCCYNARVNHLVCLTGFTVILIVDHSSHSPAVAALTSEV